MFKEKGRGVGGNLRFPSRVDRNIIANQKRYKIITNT